MSFYDAEQQEALKQIRDASSKAVNMLSAALEQPREGDWIDLPLKGAEMVREELEQALRLHPTLCDAVTSTDEALADKAWNALAYSTATVIVEQGRARAHRGRAFSTMNQLSGLASRIDDITQCCN